jgi:hypothetical protein
LGPINVLGISTVVLAALAPAFIPNLFGPSTVPVPVAPLPTPVVVERVAPNPPTLVQAPAGSVVLPVPNTAPIEMSVQPVVAAPENPPTVGIVNVISPVAPAPVAPAASTKVVPETPAALRGPILASAAKHGVPAEILSAALARESANFKDKYVYGWHVDGTGRGIAGIDKVYHPEVSDAQAFDPNYSIDWMAIYLSGLIKKNKGDVYSALREYNGGPNFASMRAGYLGRPVAELTKAHADAIFAHAAKAIVAR